MNNMFSMQSTNVSPQKAPVPAPSPAAVNGTTLTQIPRPPKGIPLGNFVIVTFEDMAKATKSKMLAKYVNVGSTPIDLNLTKGKSLYVSGQRQS